MKTLLIKKLFKTEIYITEDIEKRLKRIIKDNNAFLITDFKTKNFLKTKFKNKLLINPYKKELSNQKTIFNFFIENRINRETNIVVLGGGSLSDIVGFICGIWMRGVDYIIIPTTLLSQIDASIGGKTALDLFGIKNIIGVFHFPKSVIINPYFTLTQEKNSYLQAIGELFKYTIIMDEKKSIRLSSLVDGVVKKDIKSINECINICINFKKNIVEKDPFDKKGIREILNFGHTLAHALEKNIKISHGDAVFYGCIFELILSLELGLVNKKEISKHIEFFHKYEPKIHIKQDIFDNLYEKIKFDKKNINSSNIFLVKTKTGIKSIKDISKKTLKKVWRILCQREF